MTVSAPPVLKILFGPPTADFVCVWSPQKVHKFQQIQPSAKVRILCFDRNFCRWLNEVSEALLKC